MKLRIDGEQLLATAGPLREAATLAVEMTENRTSFQVRVQQAGHQRLAGALGEFLDAWTAGLGAAARHSTDLVRIIDRATGQVEARPGRQARETA